MNRPIRIMIDMETPSSEKTTAPLALGACVFNLPFGVSRPKFYEKASLASIEMLKFDVSKSTMEWWDKQDAAVRAEVFSGSQAVDDLLDHFHIWVQTLDHPANVELWSRGAGFDCEILQHCFYRIFGSYPFDFRKHMCQRTVERLMPQDLSGRIPVCDVYPKHHALGDAMQQADVMDIALRNIAWNGGYVNAT